MCMQKNEKQLLLIPDVKCVHLLCKTNASLQQITFCNNTALKLSIVAN